MSSVSIERFKSELIVDSRADGKEGGRVRGRREVVLASSIGCLSRQPSWLVTCMWR